MKTKKFRALTFRGRQMARVMQWLVPLPFLAISAHSQLMVSRLFTVNQAVPDGSGSLLNAQTISVGSATIDRMTVSLNVTGRGGAAFNGDLYASIGNDSGGFAVLLNRSGKSTPLGLGYSDNGFNVTFDDQASNGDVHTYRRLGTPGANPLTGRWQPDGRNVDPLNVVTSNSRTAMLSSFHNTSASGLWHLFISDSVSTDAAQLVSWGVTLFTTAAPTGALAFSGDTIQGVAPQTFNNNVTLSGHNTISGPHPLSFTAPITDASGSSGSLTVSGGAAITLTANNSYSGGTTIDGGHLIVNNTLGSGTGSGSVNVANGGILSGGGAISGNVVIANGGIIAPGNSPGTLTVGDTTFSGGGTYLWYINQASGAKGQNPGWSLLQVNGSLTIDANSSTPFVVDLTSLTLSDETGAVHDFNPSHDYRWVFASATGGVNGFDATAFSISTAHFSNALGSGHFGLELEGNDLTLVFSAVPEPAETAAAVAIALLGFALWRRRVVHG